MKPKAALKAFLASSNTVIVSAVSFLFSKAGIITGMCTIVVLAMINSAPVQPMAHSQSASSTVYEYWNDAIRIGHTREGVQNTDQMFTIEEANLLQQQRIAYFALWTAVLVPLSLLFAALSILNQQHHTQASLDAMMKVDRPWINFQFELTGGWHRVTAAEGDTIRSGFEIKFRNHGKQPAERVRFDFVTLIGGEDIPNILREHNLRNDAVEYGGPNVAMPESDGRTFGELALDDPTALNGEIVVLVVTCYYYDPRTVTKERKTTQAYEVLLTDDNMLQLRTMIEHQQII